MEDISLIVSEGEEISLVVFEDEVIEVAISEAEEINLTIDGDFSRWTSLIDTENTYENFAGYIPRVNTGEDALEFYDIAADLALKMDLNGENSYASWIDFNLTPTAPMQEGRMSWNADDGTPEVGMPGGNVNLQIGQELLVRTTNAEATDLNNGNVIYVSGATGVNIEIKKPIASDPTTAVKTFGLVTEDIVSGQKGYVTLIGNVRDIDTSGGAENWVAGEIVFLSSTVAGELTNVRPQAPNTAVIIGVVVRAHATEGVLAVKPIVVQRISLASDVLISGLGEGNVLYWDATTAVWRNTDIIHIDDENDFLGIRDGANLVMDKAATGGIKVDNSAPTFGFADIIGDQFNKNTGPTKPALLPYNGVINAWQFSTGDEAYLSFHIPHDYVKGSDIFLHVHWSHNSALVTGGDVTFKATSIYAKGHNQAAFQSVPAVGSFIGAASAVQYQHIITEEQYSSDTPSGILIDSSLLEPDGVIELTLELDSNDITSSGAVPDPFIHFVDIHYQTTGLIGTKDKVPDFYS